MSASSDCVSGTVLFAAGPKADKVNDSNMFSRLPKRLCSRSHKEFMNDAHAVEMRPREEAGVLRSCASAAVGME